MSVKKKLTDISFKRDETGRTIAYLYGRAGYVVPDATVEARLRTLKLWLIVVPILATVVGTVIVFVSFGQVYQWPLSGWCIAVALPLLIDIVQRAVVRTVTRGMTTAGPMGVAEGLQRIHEAFPRMWRFWMWYFVATAPIVFLGSVVYLAFGTWVPGHLLAVAGIVFSGCMIVGGIYGLCWRVRSQS